MRGNLKTTSRGKVLVCSTIKNLALYEMPALDCTRSHVWQARYRCQTHNISEGSTSCVQNVPQLLGGEVYSACTRLRNCVQCSCRGGRDCNYMHSWSELELVSPPTCRYISIKYKNLPHANKLISPALANESKKPPFFLGSVGLLGRKSR